MSLPQKIYDYLINGMGPLTTTVACDAHGFIRTQYVQDNPKGNNLRFRDPLQTFEQGL